MLCGFWKDQQDAITTGDQEAVKAGMLDEAAFQEWARDYSVLVARGSFHRACMGKVAAGSELHRDVILLLKRRQPGVGRREDKSERGGICHNLFGREEKGDFFPSAQSGLRSCTVDELARLIRPPPVSELTDGQSKGDAAIL